MKVIYTTYDYVSRIAGEYLERQYPSAVTIEKRETNLLFENFNNEKDIICFPYSHSSSKGIASFTTHSLGNFKDDPELGGLPKTLVDAAPLEMLSFLHTIYKKDVPIDRVYEATHHGPFVNKPSFFIELGGNSETISNTDYIKNMIDAFIESLDNRINSYTIVVGIGGMHYASTFTKLAITKNYAFSFIVSKYNVQYLDENLIRQLVAKSKGLEKFVIEKKSLNATDRNRVLSLIEEEGFSYEMV